MSILEGAKKRILILDGAMGTMIQGYALSEKDFRGERFIDHPQELKGNNDILNLTKPEIIKEIHKSYLAAGADLIETNTFNSTTISQADYQIDPKTVFELNYYGAAIARAAADEFTPQDIQKPRFVCVLRGIHPEPACCRSDCSVLQGYTSR